MTVTIRVLLGAGIGLLIGAILGTVGRCRTGACPLTGSPWRGGLFGAIFGALAALATGGGQSGKEPGNIPVIASKEEFSRRVLEAGRPVLVDFYSTTCPACAQQAPILETLAAETGPNAGFAKVDVDKVPDLAREYRVEAIPTLLLLRNGREVNRWVGLTSASTLRVALESAGMEPSGKDDRMAERKGLVTLKGNPVTLTGHEVKAGDAAPDATLLANDLSEVKLSGYRGKVVILSVVPSLDTPVCDRQTRRFNEEAAALGPDVVILTVSMDLPFAQARWCGAAGISAVRTLSDHRDAAFGKAYGVLIDGLRLLARSIFVIDREGTVRYVQVVKEIATEPDYDAALAAAKKLVK